MEAAGPGFHVYSHSTTAANAVRLMNERQFDQPLAVRPSSERQEIATNNCLCFRSITSACRNIVGQ